MARGSNVMNRVRQRGTTALAWASFLIAMAGGALATATFVGSVVRFFLDLLPWSWLPPVLLLVAVVAIGLDLFLDGVPNQVAVYGALATPSIASAAPGKMGDKVTEWSGMVLDYIDGPLIEYVGNDSSTGLAIACVAGSLLMARRVVRKSGTPSTPRVV